MLKKLSRQFVALLGFVIGVTSYIALSQTFEVLMFGNKTYAIIATISSGIILGIIFYILAPGFLRAISKLTKGLDQEISKYPQADILLGVIGLIVGFIISYLLSSLLNNIPFVGGILSMIAYIVFGYLGIRIAIKSKKDLLNIGKLAKIANTNKEKAQKKSEKTIPPKVLDTSVIIDGRIADICRTGFVEGKLIIPAFVLEELRHIADSADDLKRVRGRRGLDILNIIQKELDIEVEISETDFEDIAEVDSKLLKLAQTLNGKVVTNDFNLNKVAQFQGVEVLNINELANAVKPIAIPGEDMIVQVVKEGKENNQGVAYLDDGTMIVIDNGRKYIGDTIKVLVTSVLQTPAGRMIFAKPKN